MIDSKQRFSDRVADYVRYRPSYPPAALDFLRTTVGLDATSTVADIGSGTGILSNLLLPFVGKLYAIEPNAEMRRAAEVSLRHFENFVSLDASAEQTGLPYESVDFIVAAKAEFHRILRPNGQVILLWNNRLSNTNFLKEYDTILQECSHDYTEVNHLNIQEADLGDFLEEIKKESFPNQQSLTGQPRYSAMRQALERIFSQYSVHGRVDFNYDTNIFWGTLGPSPAVNEERHKPS